MRWVAGAFAARIGFAADIAKVARIAVPALFCGSAAAMMVVGWIVPASAACNKAINVTQNQQINYGTIAVTGSGGTVTIQANGAVIPPPGYTVTGATAGTFTVTGTNGCIVGISFAPGLLTGPAGSTNMTINNFTTNAGANPILSPAGGQLIFSVGADLLVNSGQLGGPYTGTYIVTVIYN